MFEPRNTDPGPGPVPGLAGVVLAAGRSTRFGADKRWADCRGRPLLAHALSVARAVCPRVLLVVDRPQPRLDRLEGMHGLEVVICAASGDGLAASRGCALRRLASGDQAPSGLMFFLGDMPEVPMAEARRVAERMRITDRPVRPAHAGRPGHPVAFPARLLDALQAADGRDLRGVFDREGGERLACDHPGVCHDVDRPADLRPDRVRPRPSTG